MMFATLFAMALAAMGVAMTPRQWGWAGCFFAAIVILLGLILVGVSE